MRPSAFAPIALVLVLHTSVVSGITWKRERRVAVSGPGAIRGAALTPDGQKLFTWGDSLDVWSVPDLKRTHLAKGSFGEGGCLLDADADGRLDWIGTEGEGLGKLVLRRAPGWTAQTVDDEIQMHDCLATTVLGKRGVLMVQRHAQVRFYEAPQKSGDRWAVRDIYSFYTASQQAGLVLADIDGDGWQDIVCGNYWIQSPTEFQLPWRLFAINTHSETPLSAMSRFAWLKEPDELVVSQGEMTDGRLMVFRKPADPRQLWPEVLVDANAISPHGLLTGDLDGDGQSEIVAGENRGGGSRLIVYRRSGSGFQRAEVARGGPVLGLWRLPDGRVLAAGPAGIEIWKIPAQRR